ncbi:hypothetical protein DV453_000417 [Geotrichum candidum]|nr:hypothetical protein DV453_000417 [Geotrichum candidum]
MDQSELIEQFCAITASDAETAERYLAVADQNLEAAITLFLEGGGQSFASQQQPPQSNVNSGPTVSAGSSVGAGAIDEDDEALVRRLQQEEYNSTDNDGVREAIRPVTETLVEPGYGGAGFGSRYRAPPVQRPRDIFGRDRGLDSDDEDDYGYSRGSSSRHRIDNDYYNDNDDEEEEANDVDTGMTPAQSRLSKLFRPPYDLISNYDLETAKDYGRLQKKWLLVNIQNSTEFQSHVLNRDIWANSSIKTLVKNHFVFLQYNHDSYEGQDFKSYYPFEQYPYVGILDPRTGEQMKAWSFQLPPADEFLDQLREFLATFSLDPKANNPMSRQKQDVSRMTEEDQIKYALKKSLGGAESSDDDIIELDGSDDDFQDFDEDDEYVVDSDVEILDAPVGSSGSGSSKTIAANDDVQEASAPQEEESEEEEDLTEEDIFAMIPPHEYPEPPAGVPDTTRIQFRLGDGTRVIRRFELSNTVKQVFGVVKTINDVTRTSYFSLTKGDTKENLLSKLDQTIKEAGLSNNSILVEILD